MKHAKLILCLTLALAQSAAATIEAETPKLPGDSVRFEMYDTSAAVDSVGLTARDYVVSIDRIHIDDMELDDTITVWLQSFGQRLAGFDLKIGINNPLVDIVEILPGEIYDSCRWEYFNVRQVNTYDRETLPPILWHTVALSEVIPDTTRPVCFGFNRKASLLKIVVSNEHVLDVPDTSVPLFFLWEDCTDNSIASTSGNALLISRRVVDYYPTRPTESSGLFPNRTGPPPQCISEGRSNKPQRRIEFHNGGVEFRFDVDIMEPDSTVGR